MLKVVTETNCFVVPAVNCFFQVCFYFMNYLNRQDTLFSPSALTNLCPCVVKICENFSCLLGV